ncbi:hypothetical protein [Gordonia sputi]|uniref:Uncharacterized protein n=1 Tax=Gordonia sputi NBRC 100414 TaxID=1089453 RepID=H5TXA2_9ACTN|nr:hypothetical protein [Gordonia sputi]NKY95959.1 hypothetical protein [Gordonia sputi]GAB38110.1 hypothetical protein GOSPT_026_00160 [Gordonia sputi NBRC 100414]
MTATLSTLSTPGTYSPAVVPADYAATRAGILWTAANLAADTRRRYGHRMLLDVDLLAWTLDTLIEHHPRRERTLTRTYPAVGKAARRGAAASNPLLTPELHGAPHQWMSWQQAVIAQERDDHRHPGPQLWAILAHAATLASQPGDIIEGLIPGRWPDIDRHRPNRAH